MIQKIKSNRKLQKVIDYTLEDEGITVEVSPALTESQYVPLKVDDYYNGLKMQGETPKAIDYLVTVDCTCDSYVLYLLEYKNVSSSKNLKTKDINEKFENTICMFMSSEFKDIFADDSKTYKDMKLYLVTTAYSRAIQYGSYANYINIMRKVDKKDSLKLDIAFSEKVFVFRGMRRKIEREIPPNPLISRIL